MNGKSGMMLHAKQIRAFRQKIGGLGCIAMVALIAMISAGCRSPSPPLASRVDAYRPIAPGVENGSFAAAPPTEASSPAMISMEGTGAGDGTPLPSETAVPVPSARQEVRLRVIQPGDRLEVYLHGIPHPQQLPVVVDENGFITMPLIGQVPASGKTGSEIERLIEKRYIDGGIYRNITCVVIPPHTAFFVRGEVRQPGRYPLTRDVTLLQAIALAGGYTEYAQPRRIDIQRGTTSFRINAQRIERGEELSPPIQPGDIIVVPRRWW